MARHEVFANYYSHFEKKLDIDMLEAYKLTVLMACALAIMKSVQ